MTAPSTGFRRLALGTVVATFLLIVVGGIVRVSGSGLGCGPAHGGFHAWPLCQGDIVPGVDLKAIVEFTHRALASVVVVLLFAVAVLAWRSWRAHRRLAVAATVAAGLVVAQALLGAATVEHDLGPGLVAGHLGIAMLLLGLTLYTWRAARPEVVGAEPPAVGRGFRALAHAAPAAVLATIVAGGYMAGTEHEGRLDHARTTGAHYACGHEFPTCNGGFLPFGRSSLVDVHLTHRFFMYLSVVLIVSLAVLALRWRPSAGLVHLARVAIGLLVLQVLLGALNVWIPEEYEALVVAHLATGTLLWASVLGLALQLHRVPAPAVAPAPDGAAATGEPVPA